MAAFFDQTETQEPAAREAALLDRLRAFLKTAAASSTAWADRLGGVDVEALRDRADLARIPVLRKSELLEHQKNNPPFGGFAAARPKTGGRVFMSPGPIFEIQPPGSDPYNAARAFFAAGIRPGDLVHNAFAYHMTPGGFILDEGARAFGCTVLPAGIGNTQMQVEAAASLKPSVYCGTPDFLKIMLDKAAETGHDLTSFKHGLVSGGALFPSLREEYASRGVKVMQCYASAECGVIAYESADANGNPLPGMLVNEDIIVEIVRPGTDEPVPDGEVGEVVVTTFNPLYPMIRLGTGDLSAFMEEPSPCGRTNRRIRGWMGRADQRTKVKGMFVDPRQVAELLRRHDEVSRARLVVTRENESDALSLLVEARGNSAPDIHAIAASMKDITGLSARVEQAGPDGIPNDGKVIADERNYAG
ncbi:phenylacetate--CoA ligase family protein [Nitratireductor basaltis]|uniref:Phenylacetate-CoA ligase n=1 Tax=Nitratireductor basaltis TaxID=472175 RepID=A0A084U847_9HYPH|nr:AMP-binding protein [Nitratireductor basaltis]KFB09133.1 Phenylacetate-CoA ligase [Nitratireductor basaltis]